MPARSVKQKVVQFSAPCTVKIHEQSCPAPSQDEVQVTTRISAISAGTEMLAYRGQIPAGMAMDASIPELAQTVRYPLTYGYCTVGYVSACGARTDTEWLGKRVFGFHPHATRYNTRPEDLIPLPPALADEDALFLPNMETAVGLALDGRPLIGESVLVVGQGVVGLLLSSTLSLCPLLQVDIIDLSSKRLQRGKGRGINDGYIDPALIETKYDLSYEVSGNPDGLRTAIAHTGTSGRVIIGSWYGSKEATLDLGGAFHRSKITLYSSQVSELDPALSGRWTKKRRMDLAVEMLSAIEPRQFITHEFDFEKAADAYALIDAGSPELVQVILRHPT